MAPPVTSGTVEDIVAIIGEGAYLRLAEAMGGSQFYVARQLNDDHPITRALGRDAAALFAEHFHGLRLVLPVGAWRPRAIRALADEGAGADEIARRLKLSRSYVYKVLGQSGDTRQGQLF